MNKHLFTAAFFLGALAVVWVGVGFIGASYLALAMTIIIAAVYVAGTLELRQFRTASATLDTALNAIPENMTDIGEWLAGIHASLQNPVRLRIEGERVGLPGPALTPYLLGLLVMLGMLGTFLGMVVTLNGAVFTLEKTTDLETMRSALAVPVKGLGLAFGTSVAGVATSAMLGLMSALSRRDRLLISQRLDTRIATVLRHFSLAHQRQETFKALQLQSQSLPEVVDKLQAMMVQMEGMSQQLNQRLITNQEGFHNDVKTVYTDLALAVDKSLRESLSQSAHVAGESIKPVVVQAMSDMASEAKLMHERLADTVQTQLDGLSTRFNDTVTTVADTWTTALANHEKASSGLVNEMGRSLDAFNHTFGQRADALVATVGDAYTGLQSKQAERDTQQHQAWTHTLESMATGLAEEWKQTGAQTLAQQKAICDTLGKTAREMTEQAQVSVTKTLVETTRLIASAEELVRTRIDSEANWTAQHREQMAQLASLLRTELGALKEQEAQRGAAAVERLGQLQTVVAGHLHTFGQRADALVATIGDAYTGLQNKQVERDTQQQQAWTHTLESMATGLAEEWKQTGAQTLAQQQEICDTLTKTSREMTEQAQVSVTKTLVETTRLIASAEELVRTRIDSEANWTEQHREQMAQLASLLRIELGALKEQEAQRGAAAVERLGQLQTAMAGHLTTLGTALEEPITRLIHTASEAPRAAAEVIGQLRQQISNSEARDNDLLEERSRIMETLNTVLNAINHTASEQRSMIDSLVEASSAALKAASGAFSENVANETSKLTDVAASITTSAVDVASLSEAFGFAVNAFNEANEKLIAGLERIEGAMDKSMLRSDEQLAYYVAQAREIIDLSMMSQKEIFEELRQLPARQAALADEVR